MEVLSLLLAVAWPRMLWWDGCCWDPSGGVKWEGATERVVHAGSDAVKGGPLRKREASEIDWERRRSCAARNCGDEVEFDGVWSGLSGDGYEYESVRFKRSMECVRRVWREVRALRWIGWSGLMVSVWCGMVRRRRWIVWRKNVELVYQGSSRHLEWCGGLTNPFNYPRPYAGDMSLDTLVAWCTEHQRASRVYRRKQRIAVFEAMLEVREGLSELVDKPIEFAFLFWRGKGRVY